MFVLLYTLYNCTFRFSGARRAGVLRRSGAELRQDPRRPRRPGVPARRRRFQGVRVGQADVPVDAEPGVHRAADRQPPRRPDHPAEILPGPEGRAGHGGEHTARVGADGHAGAGRMGHAAGPDAVPGLRAPPVRVRRVLGVRGGHRHQAGEPSFGHVQDGTGVRPGDGGRPGAPGVGRAQLEGDGRVRVPHRAQLQPNSAGHHGGREGIGHGEANVAGVRAREQRAAVQRKTVRDIGTGSQASTGGCVGEEGRGLCTFAIKSNTVTA